VLTELSDMELALVAGGQSANPSGPSSPGVLSGNVVRLFTDAANGASQATLVSGAKAVRSDLQGPAGTPIALGFIAAALLFLPTILSD
jgi:hypothetical protein